jgi:hypothetical protein
VRTADEYANATRTLNDRLGDLATRIGLRLLPGATRIVVAARDALNAFLAWEDGTKILETALVVLGGIAAVVAFKMLLPFLPALLMWAAIAAAIAAVIVVAEDLVAFFEGRASVTGEIIDDIRARFPRLGEAMEKTKDLAIRVWEGIKTAALDAWEAVAPAADVAMDSLGDALDVVNEAFATFFEWAIEKWHALLDVDWDAKLEAMGEFFNKVRSKIADFIESPMGKALLAILGVWLGKKIGEFAGEKAGAAVGRLVGSAGKIPYSKDVGEWLGDWLGSLSGSGIGAAAGLFMALAGGHADALATLIRPNASVPVPAGAGGQRTTHNEFHITQLPGESGEEFSRRVAEKVYREERDRDLRDTKHALTLSYEAP